MGLSTPGLTEHRPRTFLLYVRTADLTDFHLKSPWIQFPEAFATLGFRSILVAGRVRVSRRLRSTVYETGLTTESWIDALRELPIVAQVIAREEPSMVFVYGSKSFVPLCSAWSRVSNALSWRRYGHPAKRPRTLWVNKLDWDGLPVPAEHPLRDAIRRLVIAVTSHLYDRTTTESSGALERLVRILMIARGRLLILPLGYPQNLYTMERYRDHRRRPLILCVSRIAHAKGLEVLLSAFGKAPQSHEGWELVLAGPTAEPAYLESLKAQVERLSLSGSVRFTGFIPDSELRSLYLEASIFCLPSLSENAGQVRYEAMANGIPLVTTPAGSGDDLRSFGARVVPSGSIDALAQTLVELMVDDALRAQVADEQQTHLQSYLDICKGLIAELGQT